MAWAWWLGIALLLAVAEILSLDLFLIMLAGGALVGLVLALLGTPFWVQVLGFSLASSCCCSRCVPGCCGTCAAGCRWWRPTPRRSSAGSASWSPRSPSAPGGSSSPARSGRRATENDEVVPSGAEVRVVRIAGATAVVTRHLDPIVQDPGPDVPSAPVDPSQETSS